MGVKINKLFDSSWDKVEYGEERTKNTEISVLPLMSDTYEESTTADMDGLLSKKMIQEDFYKIFLLSPWCEKYSKDDRKVEKKDIPEIYSYFKEEVKKHYNYNLVEILCAVCEFFNLNYSHVYNNVLSLGDKSKILEILETDYGLKNEYSHCKKLF